MNMHNDDRSGYSPLAVVRRLTGVCFELPPSSRNPIPGPWADSVSGKFLCILRQLRGPVYVFNQ